MASPCFWGYAVTRMNGIPNSRVSQKGDHKLAVVAYVIVALMIVFAFTRVTTVGEVSPIVLYSFLFMFATILFAQITNFMDNKRLLAQRDRSIEEISRSEERYQELATHDSLTQLCNRSFFISELDGVLASESDDSTPIAVLFIDLDR